MKKSKVLLMSLLCVVMFLGMAVRTHAAPAPSLTFVNITDVTADESDRVYIEIFERGTSRNRVVYCNGRLLRENLNEMIMVDLNRDGIIDGYRRFFDTGYTVNDITSGFSLDVTAQYTNAMRPWNTISANRIFTFN